MTMLSKELSLQRRQKKLSQSQVAAYMSEHGFPLTQKGISKWECGDTLPNAEQFLQLCALYDIRDVLSVFLNAAYPCLNELGKQRLKEYSEMLLNDERFREDNSRACPVFMLSNVKEAADFEKAENGTFLDKNADIPGETNFAIRLSDESMAPLFEKGRILFIKKQKQLDAGAFGLFVYNGSALCRLYMPGEQIELISANVDYAPIRVDEKKDFEIIGSIIDV